MDNLSVLEIKNLLNFKKKPFIRLELESENLFYELRIIENEITSFLVIRRGLIDCGKIVERAITGKKDSLLKNLEEIESTLARKGFVRKD